MSALYEVIHRTEYRNSTPVLISNQALHLEPRNLEYQQVLASEIAITPKPVSRYSHIDYFGNRMTFLTIGESHSTLQVNCRHEVRVEHRRLPAPSASMAWDQVEACLHEDTELATLRVLEFRFPSPGAPFLLELRDWSLKSFPAGRPLLEAALELNSRIFEEFTFDTTATSVSTPIEEVMKLRRGVCQDFAQLAVACFRSLGLPARYVSGYLRTSPPPGQPRRFGADASHAWCSIYCPQIGWIDLDPTNDKLVDETYITLGWGRDYSDVSLIRGVLSGGDTHELYLSVNVSRLDEEELPNQISQSQSQSQVSSAGR